MWKLWEVGHRAPAARKLPALAAALGVPIASLVVDELVLIEVRVSDETLERVKREGRPAAREVAERLAANIEALLLAAASRPAIDLSPGARAKPRRSREQLLLTKVNGIAAAERHARDVAERRRHERAVVAAS